jgi:hypothetical protein
MVRGDGINFPMVLDKVEVSMKARIYHNGRRVHREKPREIPFVVGMSGKSIHVQILGARNLRCGDMNGTADPFVVYSFSGKPLHQTRVRHRTLNPRWNNETIVVPMDEHLPLPRDCTISQKDVFRLEVFDKDFLSNNEFLGQIAMHRSKLMKLAVVAQEQPIRIPLTSRDIGGLLHVQLAMTSQRVWVKVCAAEDLDKRDAARLNHAYVKVFLGDPANTLLGMTPVIKNTINPIWNQHHIFSVPIEQFLAAEAYIAAQVRFYRSAHNLTSTFAQTTSQSGFPMPASSSEGNSSRAGRRANFMMQKPSVSDHALDEFNLLPDYLGIIRFEVHDQGSGFVSLPLLGRASELLGRTALQLDTVRKHLPQLPSSLYQVAEDGSVISAESASVVHSHGGPPGITAMHENDLDALMKRSRRSRRFSISHNPQVHALRRSVSSLYAMFASTTSFRRPTQDTGVLREDEDDSYSWQQSQRRVRLHEDRDDAGEEEEDQYGFEDDNAYGDQENNADERTNILPNRSTMNQTGVLGDINIGIDLEAAAAAATSTHDQQQQQQQQEHQPEIDFGEEHDKSSNQSSSHHFQVQNSTAIDSSRAGSPTRRFFSFSRAPSIPSSHPPTISDALSPARSLRFLSSRALSLMRGTSGTPVPPHAVVEDPLFGSLLRLQLLRPSRLSLDPTRSLDEQEEEEEEDLGYIVVRLLLASRGSVLQGLDLAVQRMTVGETAHVKCRFDLAYGSYCLSAHIPPRACVIFTVSLLSLNGKGRDLSSRLNRVAIRLRRVLQWILAQSVGNLLLLMLAAVTGVFTQIYQSVCRSEKAKEEAAVAARRKRHNRRRRRNRRRNGPTNENENSYGEDDDDEDDDSSDADSLDDSDAYSSDEEEDDNAHNFADNYLSLNGQAEHLQQGSYEDGDDENGEGPHKVERPRTIKPDRHMQKHLSSAVRVGGSLLLNYNVAHHETGAEKRKRQLAEARMHNTQQRGKVPLDPFPNPVIAGMKLPTVKPPIHLARSNTSKLRLLQDLAAEEAEADPNDFNEDEGDREEMEEKQD